MNGQYILLIINLLLWLVIAASTMYVFFFSMASLIPSRKQPEHDSSHRLRFLVIIPAYHEDAVIINTVESFLHQDYPTDLYQLVVVSDNMKPETNDYLSSLPITLLQPSFQTSSKAQALQYAIAQSQLPNPSHHHQHQSVVILDADNIVKPDFLNQLNPIAVKYQAVQCHRTAKNADNDISALDGFSEEINNSIFRRGHNRIGMSSALIGSGMCFNYEWFKSNVNKLDSAVEDRELEALLMKQGIYIHYAEDILVKDEKVSDSNNFQRQRLRWMTGQVQALIRMLPYLPKAVMTGNINYIDKTVQQALIPRSILLILTPLLTLFSLAVFGFTFPTVMWAALLCVLVFSLYNAIPSRMRSRAILNNLRVLPKLTWRMMLNFAHIRPQNKEFIHTTHKQ